MNLKLKRTPGIYIIGFMGSGKTTIGRMLADEIGWRFADLDDDIEHTQHRSISEIFKTDGEEEFRRIEFQAIQQRVRSICRGTPTVLALGGGAYTRPETINCFAKTASRSGSIRRSTSCANAYKARTIGRSRATWSDSKSCIRNAASSMRKQISKSLYPSNDSRAALADLLKLKLLD